MKLGEGELLREGIRLEDADVCDNPARAPAREALLLPSRGRRELAHRGHEVDSLDEGPRALMDNDQDVLARSRNFRRAARAREPDLRVLVVLPYKGAVDVGELVDLRSTQDPHIDTAGLQPVIEYLWHANGNLRAAAKGAVRYGQGQVVRAGAERAGLEHQVKVGGMRLEG